MKRREFLRRFRNRRRSGRGRAPAVAQSRPKSSGA